MFHKLLGKARDDLDRFTPRLQEGLCTEIKQSKRRRSHNVTLKENPCPRPEERSENSVHQTSTEAPQSSAGIPKRNVGCDLRKQLELSVPQCKPGEWKHEFRMSTFTATTLNLFYAGAEKKGKIRSFWMYVGPGSDGSSGDKLSLDLKFNHHLQVQMPFDEQDSLHAI